MESRQDSWYILSPGSSSDNIFEEDFRTFLREERDRTCLVRNVRFLLEGLQEHRMGIWKLFVD